jgi:hypothetical protein
MLIKFIGIETTVLSIKKEVLESVVFLWEHHLKMSVKKKRNKVERTREFVTVLRVSSDKLNEDLALGQ